MANHSDVWIPHLLGRLRRVQADLGVGMVAPDNPSARFADVLDSMGLVEFLAVLAEDCGVTPAALEQCVQRRFGTVAEFAAALQAAGLEPRGQAEAPSSVPSRSPSPAPSETAPAALPNGWLASTVACLPDTIQPAAVLNAALHRPSRWLESHAGIHQRCIWADQDPLQAAVQAGRQCLDRAGLLVEEVGVVLVTSEAPPLLTGLAAALHHRLDLRPSTVALDVGGACTGFLAALWLGQAMLARVGIVLVICLEAPTRFLEIHPGPAGEAAALFGDGAAACLLCSQAAAKDAVPLAEVELGVDGKDGSLIQVACSPGSKWQLHLDGVPLATRAVRVMAQSVFDQVQRSGLVLSDLAAIVAHGGNGRLPALLARRLGLRSASVWSEPAVTGNLGSASLPVAWAAHSLASQAPVVWTAVGAGLTWGACLTGRRNPTAHSE
jgi:3-oxoacyl-[acyl-carrier-protein] synthase-3